MYRRLLVCCIQMFNENGMERAFRWCIRVRPQSRYYCLRECKQTIKNLSNQGKKFNALDQLELRPCQDVAIWGYCLMGARAEEFTTHPFQVVSKSRGFIYKSREMKWVQQQPVKFVKLKHGGIPSPCSGSIPGLLHLDGG